MHSTTKSGFWPFILLFLLLNNCAKHSGNSGPGSTPPLTAPEPGTTPGIVNVSTHSVTLHVNGQAQLSANAYDGNGSRVSPQPALTWTSSNPAVASVTQTGQIKALTQGKVEVVVSDGSHGDGLIEISIVPDTVAIASGPASISFSPFWTKLAVNSRSTIPSYTITDSSGQVLMATPSFELQNVAGASVDGNTIVSGSATGAGLLLAKVNGKYLTGSMPVAVYDPNKPNGGLDTAHYICGIQRFPIQFNFYNETANIGNIVLQIVTYKSAPGGGFYFSNFTAPPTSVSVKYPDLIDVTAGVMTSKAPGGTPVTIYYKDAYATANSFVGFDVSGSWGGSAAGVNYNFCLPKNEGYGPGLVMGINYGMPNWLPGWSNGMGMVTVTGTAYVGDGVHASPYKNVWALSQYYWNLGPLFQVNNVCGEFTAVGPGNTNFMIAWTGDVNKLTLRSAGGGTIATLARGAGNCTAPVQPALSLSQLLVSQPWHGSACLNRNLLDVNSSVYAFKSDGTGAVNEDGQIVPITWSVDQNNVLTIIDNIGAVVKFTVSSFGSTGINFSLITANSVSQNISATYTPASTGCNLGLTP